MGSDGIGSNTYPDDDMLQENGMKVKEHLCFMHDALKNVTSIFDEQQKQKIRYGYAPFGSLITEDGALSRLHRQKISK